MSIWPIDNRSTSLHIDFHYLKRHVGRMLFDTYEEGLLDDEQQQFLGDIIDEGYKAYVYPPVLPPEYALGVQHVHEWSFLKPIHTFITTDSQRRYPLPENFESIVGDVAYSSTSDDFYSPIKVTSPSRLLVIQNQANYTAPPRLAAIEQVSSDGDIPQTQMLVLHPTPDGTYELSMQFRVNVIRLSDEHPYPLGGQRHGTGILHACMAVAELRKGGDYGPYHRKFMDTLASNVARDYQRDAAVIGRIGERHGWISGRGDARRAGMIFSDLVTYNGQLYEG